MIGLIGFLRSPLFRELGVILAVIAVLGGIYWLGNRNGAERVRTEVLDARQQAVEKSNEIDREVRSATDADLIDSILRHGPR